MSEGQWPLVSCHHEHPNHHIVCIHNHLNQVLEDMLRACVMNFVGCLGERLPLMEFSYNNNYQATIQIAPFEALYGRRCQTPVFWEEVGTQQLMRLELVQATNPAIQKIRSKILTAKSRQKSYLDTRKRDLEFAVGKHIFLKVAPIQWVLRFGKKGKLSPRFIGPFEILERIGVMAYKWRCHPLSPLCTTFFMYPC